MPRFRIRVKLQGLEIEYDGEREDVPQIKNVVAGEIAGLLSPVTSATGEAIGSNGSTPADAPVESGAKRKAQRASRSKQGSGPTAAGARASEIDWSHDTAGYGLPRQEWSTAEKSVWLLYAALKQASVSALGAYGIETVFNNKFLQAGRLRRGNVERDLDRRKGGPDAWVTEVDGKYSLTHAGETKAQELVAAALRPTAASYP